SRAGFDQRLTRFGKELKETVQTKAYDRVSALIDLNTTIAEHDRASEEERRLGRIEMAIRLVQWLEQQQDSQPELRSFEEAADLHLRQDGYVDWARHCLRSGDPQGELSAAYSLLFDNVTEQREKHSAKFAQLLAGWTAAGSKSDDVLPVERILGSFVCPLAAARHVLVVVLDGLSVAVARELLVDVTRHEWREICQPGRTMNRPGIATIPSVTEFSRTSLLSGKFRKGNQEIERQEFQSHPG
ncbi:MAG: BREX-2 system phosphatase PglZ, partial [Fuerstiella sp.]|nr:BREX-2 system phosphatase PglZ [Fuerstiella sp.]